MARPTARGVGVLLVAGGVYLAARTLGTWELYLVAFALLAAALVVWVVVAAVAARVSADRTVEPARPRAGDPLSVEVTAHNRSPLPGLLVAVRGPAGSLSDGEDLELESLGANGSRRARTDPRPARRGVHHLPALVAEAEDPLGLARARLRLGEPVDVTVYPRLVELPSCALFGELGRRREGGRRGAPAVGATEFRGIRPHVPGEPLSRVDWKATARTGELMLRELDDPAGTDLTLVLDAPTSAVGGEPPQTTYELAVTAAGSLAAYALRGGRSVSLLLYERGWRRTRLAPGHAGQLTLLETLARATPEESPPPAASLRMLRTGGGALSGARALVLVTLTLDAALAAGLRTLTDEGLQLSLLHVAVSPEPRDEERRLLLGLTAAGAAVQRVGLGDDLALVLSAAPAAEPRPALVGRP